MSVPTWVSSARLHWDFRKHGREFPFSAVDEYEESSLDTVNVGVRFEFEDRKSGRSRVGYYDKATNRLTVMTEDELIILSHYRPSRGEAYVRGLLRSTYT
jgi:pyocin large subunit-like protein